MPLVSFRRGQFFSCKTCVASDSGLEAIRFIFLFNSQFATTIVFISVSADGLSSHLEILVI
jgi:hypothetical protein